MKAALRFGTLFATALFAVDAFAAEYRVLSSNADGLPAGHFLTTGVVVKLGPDAVVTFLVTAGPNSEQKTCSGPYSGPVELCPPLQQPCSFADRLRRRCVDEEAGGTRDVK
jgi:hypothetical protein